MVPAIRAMGIATGVLGEYPRPVQKAVNRMTDELGVLAVDVQVVAVELFARSPRKSGAILGLRGLFLNSYFGRREDHERESTCL